MSKITKIYRTYFDKNNTIVRNSLVNTARNPVCELFMGAASSRFLFYTSFSELTDKINNGELSTGKLTHTLHIKNTSNFDIENTLVGGSIALTDNHRVSGADLELHLLNEPWSAGVGYDFVQSEFSRPEENDYVIGPSNWVSSDALTLWDTPGAILSGSTAIATQKLETGGEDIEMDITDIINTILDGDELSGITSGITYDYNGFGLKYSDDYEENGSVVSFLGLFTKFTNTYFEPYIETRQDITIYDDRANFSLDKENKIYLYSYIGGELKDLDELPTCTIEGTPYTPTRVTKGIYEVSVTLDSVTYTEYTQYYDTWSNIKYNAITLPDIELDITTKPATDFYQIGLLTEKENLYGISLSGIKMDERIKGGTVKTVNVNIREPYTSHVNNHDHTIEYTLYIKQGPNRITVIDWMGVDKLFNGFEFTLDTTWMVPQQYFIDIKATTNDNVRIFTEEVKFNIVSEYLNKTKI